MNDPHGQHRSTAHPGTLRRRKERFRGSARGQVLGDRDEGVRLDQDDMLSAAVHDASFLPGTEEPAHGIERCSCHLGNVLTRYRKTDLNADIHPPTGVVDESEQRASDAAFDPLGHELSISALQVVQSPRHEVERVERDRVLSLE
jgi:hypothetical protein